MYLKATQISIQSDENGFEMWIDTDEHDSIGFNIQDPALLDAFYDQVKSRIGPYLREMHEAQVAHGAARRADYDAHEAYDLSDPKHPRYHSTHADIWDVRDGK